MKPDFENYLNLNLSRQFTLDLDVFKYIDTDKWILLEMPGNSNRYGHIGESKYCFSDLEIIHNFQISYI